MDRDTQIALGRTFRTRHETPAILVLPNAWDVASAMLLARAGFEAIATTSAGIGYTAGYPVGEIMPLSEMIEAIERITRRLRLPLSVDMESGYGTAPDEVARTVARVIEAGAVGINIEDSIHDGSKRLFDFALSVERIAAAREAADATGVPFTVNARTDGYWNSGRGADTPSDIHDDAVARADAFGGAGADCIFIPGILDPATIGRLVGAIDRPLNVMGSTGAPSVAELDRLGVRRLTVGAVMARAAYGTLEAAAAELRDAGTFGFAENIASHAALNAFMSEDA
ncbi:MAG: isocitrate lyase/phosphoenolpyruvate mutase family protein [Rhodospirillaceae bacterium]